MVRPLGLVPGSAGGPMLETPTLNVESAQLVTTIGSATLVSVWAIPPPVAVQVSVVVSPAESRTAVQPVNCVSEELNAKPRPLPSATLQKEGLSALYQRLLLMSRFCSGMDTPCPLGLGELRVDRTDPIPQMLRWMLFVHVTLATLTKYCGLLTLSVFCAFGFRPNGRHCWLSPTFSRMLPSSSIRLADLNSVLFLRIVAWPLFTLPVHVEVPTQANG